MSHDRRDQRGDTAERAGAEDPGELLATFARKDGEELRISLDTYNGYEYVSVRVWFNDRPSKKGCTVKLREIEGVADALLRGLALTRGQKPDAIRRPPDANRRQTDRPRAASQQGRPSAPGLPLDGRSPNFDEFGDPS